MWGWSSLIKGFRMKETESAEVELNTFVFVWAPSVSFDLRAATKMFGCTQNFISNIFQQLLLLSQIWSFFSRIPWFKSTSSLELWQTGTGITINSWRTVRPLTFEVEFFIPMSFYSKLTKTVFWLSCQNLITTDFNFQLLSLSCSLSLHIYGCVCVLLSLPLNFLSHQPSLSSVLLVC